MRDHGPYLRLRRRKVTRRLLAALLGGALLTTASPAAALTHPGEQHLHKLDAELLQAVAGADAPVEAVVVLQPSAVPTQLSASAVLPTLQHQARATQSSVVTEIERRGGQVASTFWLKNMVVTHASEQTLRELARLDQVVRIIPNYTLSIPDNPNAGPNGDGPRFTTQADPTNTEPTNTEPADDEYTWGLAHIGVDHLHQELELDGDGVRVAVLDTGVDMTHPDLAGRMVTVDPDDPHYPGGWIEFDTTGAPVASEPRDDQAHGTHVAGTVLGGDASGTQIGVAPGAELMAGLVLPGGEGTLAQVIAGMQWAAAPHDAAGNPVGEPAHVVNMSLGAVGHHDELIEPTLHLLRAGIFPAFSIGNNCFGSSSSPGNVYDSVGVGATDQDDNVGGFSCGELIHASYWDDPPSHWPTSYTVPDLSAPGVRVLSAYPGGQWRWGDGTSMAAPHVAGTVALMLQATDGSLTVDNTLDTLIDTSYFDDRYGAHRPNTRYGNGRIDAYRAVLEVAYDSGVTGTVTDAATGAPIVGATVTRQDRDITVEVDQHGQYTLTTPPGSYDLEITRFGYEPVQVQGVSVGDGQQVQLDVELTSLPRATVTGTVTVAGSGTTVPGATVRVLDVPDALVHTSQVNGRYVIDDVPTGTYQIEAYVPGLPPSAPQQVQISDEGRVEGIDLVVPLPEATQLVSAAYDGGAADDFSIVPTVSQDGRFVVYRSDASNLVPGVTNGTSDVYLRDLLTGHTERISVTSDGEESQGSGPFLLYPMLSDDARYVVWDDDAYNLVPDDDNQTYDIFIHDRYERTTELVSVASDGTPGDNASLDPDISGDGRYVVFRSIAGNFGVDPQGQFQIWLHDRETGATELVSAAADGGAGNGFSARPSISTDGRYVAFSSSATNLVDDGVSGTHIYVVDRVAGTTERVSVSSDGTPANSGSGYGVISDDGRRVTFHSNANNLVDVELNSGRNVYVHDRQSGRTDLVSVSSDGEPANALAHYPSINSAGTHVSYYSPASNLVDGDTNDEQDVFVHELATGITERTSVAADGSQGSGYAQGSSLSHDAGVSAFHSTSTNLVDQQTSNGADVYVRHRGTADPAAHFTVFDLRVRGAAQPGQPMIVTARVKNIGDAVGEYPAQVWLDDRLIADDQVTISPGRTWMLQFRVSPEQIGEGQVRIGAVTTTVPTR